MNARVSCAHAPLCSIQPHSQNPAFKSLQVASGGQTSTSGRATVTNSRCRRIHDVLLGAVSQPKLPYNPLRVEGLRETTALRPHRTAAKQTFRNLTLCQAQKTKQESERPVMERLESDLIAGVSSNGNGVKRTGSAAPTKNSATNIADRTDDIPEAETSQDDDGNVDSGAQSHEERSNGTAAKAASKVPGGVTEADNLSAPKPASFWLPHPEPEDMPQVTALGNLLFMPAIVYKHVQPALAATVNRCHGVTCNVDAMYYVRQLIYPSFPGYSSHDSNSFLISWLALSASQLLISIVHCRSAPPLAWGCTCSMQKMPKTWQ